jgi:hypothetical protein
MAADERENLFADLISETAASWNRMSLAWRAITLAGVALFVVAAVVDRREVPGPLVASIRVLALAASYAGSVASTRGNDDFFQRVYLHACAYTFVISTIVLYALFEFGIDLGVRAVSLIVSIFLLSFVAAFAVLRRA